LGNSTGRRRPPRCSEEDGGHERATPDTLHRIYSALLAGLQLTRAHRAALQCRGLSDAEIDRRSYRTLDVRGRARLAGELRERFGDAVLRVPGFVVKQGKDGRPYVTIAGAAGLLVPIRDAAGRVVALLVRRDDPPNGKKKYSYVSSTKWNGPGPGAPVHCPPFEGDTETVRITEGALKADIATDLSGMRTIGQPGVSMWQRAAKALRQVGAKTVRLSFDADVRTNRNVAGGLLRLAQNLKENEFAVEVERWDPADGKGIDDVLAAGKTPEVLTGDTAFAAIREWADATGVTEEASEDVGQNEKIDDPHRLARLWLEVQAAHPDRPRAAYYREQFWLWNGRHWQATPDAEMRGQLARFCKWQLDRDNREIVANWKGDGDPPKVPKVTTGMVSNVLQALGGEVLLSVDTPQPAWLGEVPEPRNYLAMANGLLDVDAFLAGAEKVLLPHTPTWFSPVCLPYDFAPEADCPRWKAVLQRNLAGEPYKVSLLQQFAGYLLLPDTSFQRFLMMVGEGANGKSVVCAAIRALLGDGNISTVPLELFGDKFRLAGTLGKLANITAEVGELDKVAEGQLKAFVTGDPLEFERKFKAPFKARPTARLVLATNNPPQFSDKSDGLWRRMLLLKFTVQIPEAERVAGMDSVEFWQKTGDLPGMLNWALAGLHALRQAGRFTVPAECQEDVERLRTDSNPARRFLQEYYQAGAEEIPTADLYKAYRDWCSSNGHFALAEGGFGKEVSRRFPSVTRRRLGPVANRYWAYCGLERRRE
jgi:P4 family phage/plasmid primase-like protien